MSFSPRATQLMRELDQYQIEFEALIATLVAEMRGACDPAVVTADAAEITRKIRSFEDFRARVDLGPDEPVDGRGPSSRTANVTWAQLQRAVEHAQRPFRKWGILRNWVDLRLNFESAPLYPPEMHEDDTAHWQEMTRDNVFLKLHDMISPKTQDDSARDSFAYADIALPLAAFTRYMHAAYRVTLAQGLGRPARFLDVGCGVGMTVLSAAQFFDPAEGIDLDAGYIAAAQKFLAQVGQTNATAHEADGLLFEDYGAYDVIYFYRPIHQETLLHQLEERIVKTARPDAVLIAPDSFFDFRFKDLGCAQIAGRMYLAQASQEEADALRDRAERIGPVIPQPDIREGGVWTPLERELRRTGFG